MAVHLAVAGDVLDGVLFCAVLFLTKPGRVAQSVGHLTRKSEVLSSISGLAT